MAGSEATFESFDRVEFETARGLKITGKALTLTAACTVLRLLDEVGATGAGAAQAQLIEHFAKVTEIGDPNATIGEMLQEVIPHFLSFRGNPGPTSTGSSTTGGMT